MEFSNQDMVVLRSFMQKKSTRAATGASVDPERVQQDDSEPDTQSGSNQGTPERKNDSPPRTLIEFRIQQLHNRRFILLEMQKFRKEAEDNSGGTTEEMAGEDSDRLCELEAIQKELEELLVKKKELEKQGQQTAHPIFRKTPRGGIYLLPPPQDDLTSGRRVKTRPAAESPTGPVVPVDSLDQTSAVTTCPSCREVVATETHSKAGEAVWALCCLSFMMGGVAGCCLIPFFMDRLRNVRHQCSNCQAHIHTYKPF